MVPAVLSISWRTSSATLWTKLSEHQPSIRSTDCDLRCWILIRTLGPIYFPRRNPLELNNVKVCLCEDKECIRRVAYVMVIKPGLRHTSSGSKPHCRGSDRSLMISLTVQNHQGLERYTSCLKCFGCPPFMYNNSRQPLDTAAANAFEGAASL
jgi:hypothetical protein